MFIFRKLYLVKKINVFIQKNIYVFKKNVFRKMYKKSCCTQKDGFLILFVLYFTKMSGT